MAAAAAPATISKGICHLSQDDNIPEAQLSSRAAENTLPKVKF
jgi:hypothetical protein